MKRPFFAVHKSLKQLLQFLSEKKEILRNILRTKSKFILRSSDGFLHYNDFIFQQTLLALGVQRNGQFLCDLINFKRFILEGHSKGQLLNFE